MFFDIHDFKGTLPFPLQSGFGNIFCKTSKAGRNHNGKHGEADRQKAIGEKGKAIMDATDALSGETDTDPVIMFPLPAADPLLPSLSRRAVDIGYTMVAARPVRWSRLYSTATTNGLWARKPSIPVNSRFYEKDSIYP